MRMEWGECNTSNHRCEGIQKKTWTDIERITIGGGLCPI